jgi:hypothetical protein
MSEQQPEANELRGIDADRNSIFHEEKSVTGSAQTLAFEPSDNFVAPSMALDSFEPESDS